MSENSIDALGWLHGLEDYLAFTKEDETRQYVRFILKLFYAEEPVIEKSEKGNMREFIFTLRKFASAPVLDILYKYYREGHDPVALQDAFSRGQVNSKIWLATELEKIKNNFTNIHIFAGWYGQLLTYLDTVNITYDKARIIDLDPVACRLSDTIFNLDKLENYRVKSSCCSLDDLVVNSDGISLDINLDIQNNTNIVIEKLESELIINTSSEHMTDDWFFKLKFKRMSTNPIIVIQSNNMFDIPEHINCVHSISHMMKKFPMEKIYYSGEIKLAKYKRFMLIGRLN